MEPGSDILDETPHELFMVSNMNKEEPVADCIWFFFFAQVRERKRRRNEQKRHKLELGTKFRKVRPRPIDFGVDSTLYTERGPACNGRTGTG